MRTIMSKREEMQNPNHPFPHELIEKILLRLPVRSLLRLKRVCKSWLSLISDPKFAKSHYDLAYEPTHRFIFKLTYGSEVKSIDIEASLYDDSSVSNHVLPHKLDDLFDDKIQVYASYRGILLLCYEHCDLLLWNPTTGVHKPIPCPNHPHYKFTYFFLYGFWYDASTDDYMVLLMAKLDTRPRRRKKEIVIFSLKTNSWNQIENVKFPYLWFLPTSEAGLLLNGALHWLVYSTRDVYKCVIIAFDLIQRSLLEIPLPHDDIGIDMKGVHLKVMGDCLCLFYPANRARDAVAEIWMMKDYKVHSSWTKSFVVSSNDFFLPICLTKSKGLFGLNCSERLVKFNSEGVLVEHRTWHKKFFRENPLQYEVYRESLLSLPGDFGKQ